MSDQIKDILERLKIVIMKVVDPENVHIPDLHEYREML